MSDQLTLVESDRPATSHQCCCERADDAVSDRISYFAMGFVLVGLVFSAIGFLYPRDLQRDPNASAAENEKADQEFMQLTQALNAIIVTGMVLIGIGGLILSALFTNSVVCEGCHSKPRHQHDVGRQMTSRSTTSTQATQATARASDSGQNYGTVRTGSQP